MYCSQQTFTQWTKGHSLLDLEGHGREAIANDIDIANGWLVYNYLPVVLTSEDFPARGGTEGH